MPLRFQELIQKLCEKYSQRVVIFVDEYDRPITDALHSPEQAEFNRQVLRDFFSGIKLMDEFIAFVFLTGVSKFTWTSLFPKLNNLVDLTFHDRAGTVCGYSHDELQKYFSGYLTTLVEHRKESKQEVLDLIRQWYNGYSWTGERKVYNPFSL